MPKITWRVFLLGSKISSNEEGVTSIEYALIAAMISVVGIGAFSQVSKNTQAAFASIEDVLMDNVTTQTRIDMNEKKTENKRNKISGKVKKKEKG